MSKDNISSRWKNQHEAVIARNRILKVLKKGGVLKARHSPFNMNGEFKDFRGLDLSKLSINKLVVKDADFSFVSFESSIISKSVFKNIYFEKANFSDFSDYGNNYEKCAFSKCRFKESGIGYSGSKYKDCVFEECNFTRSIFIRGEFDNCEFNDCTFRNIDFNASSFFKCYFTGVLDGVWFRGNYAFSSDEKEFGKARKNLMTEVSFKNALLKGINFSNDCDLSSIIVPSTGNYYLFNDWEKRLQKLKQEISGWPEVSREEATVFVNSYLVHAKNQNWFLLNIEETQRDFSANLANKMVEILIKA